MTDSVRTSMSSEVAGMLVTPALQHEIEQYLYAEAELLDEWRFREWLNLLADDISYNMPVRVNRLRKERRRESGLPIMAHFDDDKASMEKRVKQLELGTHWSEDPLSRTRHLVTNVRIRPAEYADPESYEVRSNFLCYRNRLETEVDIWAGQREDLLRRRHPSFCIARRTIMLDQSVVLSKNLSVFL